ncbi:MAG TPA: hemerythrin domain-containing protein [Flavisolibacter sp.]
MRYNIFNQIHKGLRAMLYDTAVLLQQTDFTDPSATAVAADRTNAVLKMFEDHASHEDNYVFAAISAYEPSVADAFMQEHHEDERLAQQVADSLQALEYASTAVKPEMAIQLNRNFVAFLAFNLSHMEREESVINRLLWRYYSDEAIMQIQQQVIASLSPEAAATGTEWMFRGLNDNEIIGWLKGVRANAPEEAFENLVAAAANFLPANRFDTIINAVSIRSAVA